MVYSQKAHNTKYINLKFLVMIPKFNEFFLSFLFNVVNGCELFSFKSIANLFIIIYNTDNVVQG